MRKSIDTYVKAIAHDNEQEIRENFMTVADYIINDAENCTGYYEYFDDDELDETGEPSEAQIEELVAFLRENYTTPIEHRIEDIMLTKHSTNFSQCRSCEFMGSGKPSGNLRFAFAH